MKKYIIAIMLSLTSISCVHDDVYKMKYPQQEISKGLSVPMGFSRSNKAANEYLDTPHINTNTPSSGQKVKRKPVGQTLEFLGNEDNNTGVKVVKRKQ